MSTVTLEKRAAFELIHGYKIEELDLEKANSPYPYEKKDGRVFFFLDIEHLKNGEKAAILNEKNEELSKILGRKYVLSKQRGKSIGLYKSVIEWLEPSEKEENDSYDNWLQEKKPQLANLEQGFYVADSCPKGEECGFCGSYLIIRKADFSRFRIFEEHGVIENFLNYFGHITKTEKGKLEMAWNLKKAETYAGILDNLNYMVDSYLKNWTVWNADLLEEVIRKEFLDPEAIEKLAKEITEFLKH